MRRLVLVLLALALALSACAVPRERDDVDLVKVAAGDDEVTAIFERYRTVRNTAISLLDPKPLSTVETGAVLAIDSGSFEVAQRLSTGREQDESAADVVQVVTPRFSRYPLWFMAVVRDEDRDVNRVQIFERESAAAPWLLVATPETLLDAELPELRIDDGAAVRVNADDDAGISATAQATAEAYALLLTDPEDPAADRVEQDAFIELMRETAAQNAGLEGVTFEQTWEAQDVRHVLRTADGGALAFVDLVRTDSYEVEDGVTVTWPEDSPQRAFIQEGISTSGSLEHNHQVLVHLPGGDAKPRAIGQFGGVVGATGF